MYVRQSTMFKLLKTFVIISLALSGMGHGQMMGPPGGTTDLSNNTNGTKVVTVKQDSDDKDNDDTGLLIGILDILSGGPLGIIFVPLGVILRPIFTLVDFILKPILGLVRLLLSPVIFVLNVILIPVHGLTGLLGSVGSLVASLLANVGKLVAFLISNVSGLLSVGLYQVSSGTAPNRRKKRAIMDSMTGMVWETLTFPFRIVFDIINMILSPFYLIYNTAMWPYHFIFGGDSDGLSSALSTDFSINNMVSSFLLNLSESSQAVLSDMLVATWAYVKSYLFPALDNIFVSASTSSLVPDDVKGWLKSLHSAYSILHMFGLV